MKNKTFHKRKILVVFAGAFAMIFVLIGRLTYLMVFDAEYYQKKAEELHERERDIKAARGEIVDVNGTVLATSEKIYNLVLDPYVITQSTDEKASEYVAEVLEEYFSIDQATVKKTSGKGIFYRKN